MPQHWGPKGWSGVQGWQLRFLRSMSRCMDMSMMCGNFACTWLFGPIPRCRPAHQTGPEAPLLAKASYKATFVTACDARQEE